MTAGSELWHLVATGVAAIALPAFVLSLIVWSEWRRMRGVDTKSADDREP